MTNGFVSRGRRGRHVVRAASRLDDRRRPYFIVAQVRIPGVACAFLSSLGSLR
jgi:hypothetical protein